MSKNLVAVGFVITNTGSTSLGVGQSASPFTAGDLPHLLGSQVGLSAAGFVAPPRLFRSESSGFARKVQDSLILCLFEGCQCFVVALATRFGIPGSPLTSSKLKDLS